MARPVMLLQLGEAPDAVRAEHGHYASWYERAWGGQLSIVDGRGGGQAPDPRGFAAIIVTGSSASLTPPEPWMDDAGELVQRAADAGTPVLGVCFGHQLIGRVLGGRVVENPRGWEIGTEEIALTATGSTDPLFDGVSALLRVNLVHQDMIDPDSLPATASVLAANPKTEVQAVAAGHLRGVQFHPEITGSIVRAYISSRRAVLGVEDPDALLAGASDAPDAVSVLQNFRRHFADRS